MAGSTRQTITFTKTQAKWMAVEAERLDITVSELIRRIVDGYRGVRVWGDHPDGVDAPADAIGRRVRRQDYAFGSNAGKREGA